MCRIESDLRSDYTESIVIPKKIWNDPVWSRVIAAAIIAAVGAICVTYRQYWLPSLRGEISAAWAYSTAASPVRHWVFGMLVLGCVLFVLLLIGVAGTFFPEKKTGYESLVRITPEWYDYTSDTFFELKWRWSYDGGAINLNAYCPRCEYQVFPDDTSAFTGGIKFYCDSCKRNAATIEESWDSIRSKVTRFIQQKIQTGSYPTTGDQDRRS